ncbi:hypothetical protein KKF05_04720 [Patescibacteria group bacterium]|nr:hypothetical protein [Patescibacteria group bacterium]MBU1916002.1 hypothetical protein [Patescibacteria group bacterium]
MKASAKKNLSPMFGDDVKLISYCPLCGSSYTPLQTQILGEKEDSHLMHIQCGNCSNAIIALVIISSVGVSSVGLVTDLGSEEVDRFRGDCQVTTNDVIDMHHLLQDEEKLFARLA